MPGVFCVKKHLIETGMAVLMLLCFYILSREAAETAGKLVNVSGNIKEEKVILVDAGHGGADSGMIGVDGLKEKGINLEISVKLKKVLEKRGYTILMTREEDKGLYEENTKNMKAQDLQNRIAMIKEYKPLLAVSIHQNSFPDASVSGPQVFYFEQSAESSAIASVMQDTLNNSLNPPKPRVCKSNNDYYILKKTPTPIIIVECGFLSNETEAALLVTDAYQEKLVRAVYLGAITYLESGKDVPDTAT